jgi:RimJ/RimL family protein N-acetyltransferase
LKHYLSKNGQAITIREARENDAAAITSVIDSVASEKYYIVPERSREDWDEAIREIKKRNSLIIIAQVNQQTVGMACLTRGKFEKNKHVGFLGITILKDFRGVGIGNAIMKYIVEWAKLQEALEKISLTVFSTNKPAIELYKKFGFKIEGVSKKQYRIEETYIDDVIMAKFLDK